MAGLAQCHQVIEVVGTALAKREDVVDFLGWGEPAVFLALLTQGVFSNVAGTNPAPLTSITFINLRVALVTPVIVLSEFGVLIAVPTMAKLRASGMRAGCWGLAWHRVPPDGNGKAPRGFCPLGALIYF